MGFKDSPKKQTKVLLKKKQVRTKKGKQNIIPKYCVNDIDFVVQPNRSIFS